ncbi:MAG: lipoprotein [Alphaproteobacteria bacterium]|nr:lipoprotein [Alphaproteobacteria bacterium]
MSSVLKISLLTIALALPLAGCGVKGSLDAPPEAKAAGTAVSPAAKGTPEGSAAKKKKHRPFILDGML